MCHSPIWLDSEGGTWTRQCPRESDGHATGEAILKGEQCYRDLHLTICSVLCCGRLMSGDLATLKDGKREGAPAHWGGRVFGAPSTLGTSVPLVHGVFTVPIGPTAPLAATATLAPAEPFGSGHLPPAEEEAGTAMGSQCTPAQGGTFTGGEGRCSLVGALSVIFRAGDGHFLVGGGTGKGVPMWYAPPAGITGLGAAKEGYCR